MSTLLEKASLVIIPSGYEEGIVYSQIPTNGNGDLSFTRASNGTRINSAGLVEVCPWNLVEYSEQFDNGVWSKYQSSVIANTTTAPNGTLTADSLIENFATDIHITFQIVTISAGVTTISVYAKANTRNHIVLYSYDNVSQFYFSNIFDLSNGTTTGANQSIENVGNGWYRCSFTFTTTVSGAHYTYVALSNGTNINYAGNGSGGVYIWGAQLNIGSTAKPYFPTTDRLNVPRLTYQNGGGGCPSLLLEKQSTNIALYSEQFDNADWTKSEVTISANSITSPDGTQNADAVIESTTSNSYHRVLPTTPFSGTGGAYYSFTTYVKKKGSTRHIYWMCQNSNDAVYAHFNMTNFTVNQVSSNGNGSNASASIIAVGNDWYRITLSGIVSTVSTLYYNQFYFENSVSTGFNPNPYTGDGVSGFYLWGWQIEASSYPTSYIPTTSSSATRVADACYKTGISSLIGQTEGALFADLKITELPTDGSLFGVQKTASNFVIRFGSQGSNIYAQCYNGSTNLFFETTSYTLGTRIKLAFAYKAGSYAFYINGTQIATGTNATSIPACDEIMTNSLWGNTNPSLYEINEAVLFPTRLTNAELASLTTI